MKKIFTLIALVGAALTASAQDIEVGGSFGFTHTGIDLFGESYGGTSFKIFPTVGLKLDDNLTAGLQIGYAHGFGALGNLSPTDLKTAASAIVGGAIDAISDEDLMDIKLNTFMIAPYARYTVFTAGKLDGFVEGSVTFGVVKGKGEAEYGAVGGKDPKATLLQVAVAPGFAYNLTDNLALQVKFGSLGFQHVGLKTDPDAKDIKINRFGFDADSYNLVFGFTYQLSL